MFEDNFSAEMNYRQERLQRHANTRFLMIFRGQRRWLTFQDCYRAVNDDVFIDGKVALDIADSGYERPLTYQEKTDISNAANDYSGDK